MVKNIKKGDLIAVVRVRGIRNIKPKIKKTLELLKLNKPNHAVIYKVNESIIGMLELANDYVSFGKISEDILVKLITKRAEIGSKRAKEVYSEKEVNEIAKEIAEKGKTEKIDPVFRLHPPRRGWKNIKTHYPRGDLGEREDMDDLIRRMM